MAYLNIIVECAVGVSVLFKKSESIRVTEIFKLNKAVLSETSHYSLHEFVNEIIIFLS